MLIVSTAQKMLCLVLLMTLNYQSRFCLFPFIMYACTNIYIYITSNIYGVPRFHVIRRAHHVCPKNYIIKFFRLCIELRSNRIQFSKARCHFLLPSRRLVNQRCTNMGLRLSVCDKCKNNILPRHCYSHIAYEKRT